MKALLDSWVPTISRYIGIAGLVYELALDHLRNPTALVVFGGLTGLPDVLGYHQQVKAQAKREAEQK